MKIYAPSYYRNFSCIANLCRHSCCIGWEIDIDTDSYEYYKTVGGEFGKRLCDSIADGECPCFTLDKDERCPFLNRDGLCDMIINLGEESLCQICRDHPRYRSFFSDRVEIGLGLCCEEAARIIVGRSEPTGIILLEDDGEASLPDADENELLKMRETLFGILQNRASGIEKRLSDCLELCGIPDKDISPRKLSELLLGLEYMETEWRNTLIRLGSADTLPTLPDSFDTAFEQLAVYFLYRHLADALEDGRTAERTAFCILCTRAIRRICALWLSERGTLTLEDVAEAARMLSSEIEYSEENTETLISMA